MNKKPAFTLVEMLLVVAVLGLLATAVIIAFAGTRARSRDTNRLSDINRIQAALNLYWQANGQYPDEINPGEAIVDSGIVFMSAVPTPPTPTDDGDCDLLAGEDLKYDYQTIGSGGSMTYEIEFCLGAPNSGLAAGKHVATPYGISPVDP